jgi:putative membrane protein
VKPLTQGADKLNLAVGEISVGAGKLKEGADKLANGSKESDENMKKFDKEGIQKISSEIDSKMGDLQDIIDVKDELVKISNNYGTFSGVGDKMDGKVKFVMKTDEIRVKIAEEKEVVEIKEEKKGFFTWIKNLFSSNTQARK